jgi:beta-mannosidase
VNEKGWIYKIDLLPPISKAMLEDTSTYALSFQGLDTFATVRLNGKVILECDNMFIPYHADITKHLNYDGANSLEIEFASAFEAAREIKAKYPGHKWICWNGDPARLVVRKAQYHWYAEQPQ